MATKKKTKKMPSPRFVPRKLPCGCDRLACGHVQRKEPPTLATVFGQILGAAIPAVLSALSRKVSPETATSTGDEPGPTLRESELEIERKIHRDLYDEQGKETPRHAYWVAVSPRHRAHAEAVRIHRAGYRVGYDTAFAKGRDQLLEDLLGRWSAGGTRGSA